MNACWNKYYKSCKLVLKYNYKTYLWSINYCPHTPYHMVNSGYRPGSTLYESHLLSKGYNILSNRFRLLAAMIFSFSRTQFSVGFENTKVEVEEGNK